MAEHRSRWRTSGARRLRLSCALVAFLSFVAAGPFVLAEGIVFHVANRCPFPVWPASAPNTGHPVLAGGGFLVPPGKSRRVVAPATWNGRFWARTGCNFTANGAAAACLTGDCEGRLACNGSVGAPPATLVEVSMHEDPGKGSSYDVSLVDGYNLPIAMTPVHGSGANCVPAGCVSDLNRVCPQGLAVRGGDGNRVVACRSACAAYGAPQYCCTGQFGSPQQCKPTAYSRLFKSACPKAYSYAYDDPTSILTCSAGASYVVTFCPHHR